MKAVYCLLILLPMCCLPLFAQWDEVPELQPEQLQDNWLEQFYSGMRDNHVKINANSRLGWDGDGLDAFIAGKYSDRELEADTNLYLEEGSVPLAGFQVAYQGGDEPKKNLAIGLMRCSWGLGNILGKSNKYDSGFAIGNAAHPAYSSLRGIAASMEHGSYTAFILASGQQRSASLSGDKIKYLYKSQKNAISTVGEEIIAGGLGYHYQSASAGIMAYRQSYRRDWVDPELQQRLPAFSFHGGYQNRRHGIISEISMIGRHPALKLELNSKLSKLKQGLGFSYHHGSQLPAYAARASLLSNQGKRHELRYDLHYSPQKDFSIELSHALSRKNSALERQSWSQRSILALGWTPSGTSINLQFTRLDKELLLETDSTFISTLPVHYRGLLKLRRQINPSLAWEMQFRYNYEEKLNTENNSFFWQNSLGWKKGQTKLTAGLKTWQSLRSMILPDEEGALPEGYTTASGDDNRMFVKAVSRLARIRGSVEFEQSWLHGRKSIWLSLGI